MAVPQEQASYLTQQYTVTPDYVNQLPKPTDEFLCPLTQNTGRYDIDFTNFKIRALHDNTETVLFQIGPETAQQVTTEADARSIKYHFGPHFLDYSTIGTTLEFSVGNYPLHNFRMIERHYFRDQLLRSYDFNMPFVMPNTTNTWEVIYDMPALGDDWKQALIAYPWETRSDSFYFVNDELVMHNKASYNYSLYDAPDPYDPKVVAEQQQQQLHDQQQLAAQYAAQGVQPPPYP